MRNPSFGILVAESQLRNPTKQLRNPSCGILRSCGTRLYPCTKSTSNIVRHSSQLPKHPPSMFHLLPPRAAGALPRDAPTSPAIRLQPRDPPFGTRIFGAASQRTRRSIPEVFGPKIQWFSQSMAPGTPSRWCFRLGVVPSTLKTAYRLDRFCLSGFPRTNRLDSSTKLLGFP